ncbi:MAG: hypothetical protein WBG89_00970 [Ornithinimicrobium sp.]
MPGPDLSRVVSRLWEEMPGPRVRTDLDETTDIVQALDAVADQLVDTESHRKDGAQRDHERQSTSDDKAMDRGDMDHGDMDHGNMEMAPDGIALAEGEEDRDGLEMDVLHLRLGPVLPHWPAGLVLSCTAGGDVILRAEGSIIDDPETGASTVSQAPNSAWRADNLAGFLALAGWEDAASLARRIRNAQLTSYSSSEIDTAPEVHASLKRLRRQVTRSLVLRRSLRGLRPLTPQEIEIHGLPQHLEGDTWDRLRTMLDQAVDAAAVNAADDTRERAPRLSPSAVAIAVVGLDLAAARLVIASLNMPPTPAPIPATHGWG